MVAETLALIQRCEKIDFSRKGGLYNDPIFVNSVVAPSTSSHMQTFYNTKDVMDLLAHDGVDPHPDAICDLILSNWNNSRMYQKQHLSGPFSTLVSKKRKESKLLAGTFLRFLQRTIPSEGFTHHCIFNPLFEYVAKLAENGAPECETEISEIRALITNNLGSIRKIAVKAATLRNKPQTVRFKDLQKRLSSFLGIEVSFSASMTFQDAIDTRDASFIDLLQTFLYAIQDGKKILSEEELYAIKTVLDTERLVACELIDEAMSPENSLWIKSIFTRYLNNELLPDASIPFSE
jgi:hypothetical protein